VHFLCKDRTAKANKEQAEAKNPHRRRNDDPKKLFLHGLEQCLSLSHLIPAFLFYEEVFIRFSFCCLRSDGPFILYEW
jgi:hypothetical protein